MENSENNRGWSTYTLGTIKSIKECLEVVVYNRYSFKDVDGFGKISKYNIDRIYEIVTKPGSPHLVLTRSNNDPVSKDDSTYFQFLSTQDKVTNGFNVIIYVSNNRPLGYTEFNNTIGKFRDIYFKPKQNAEIGYLSIELNDSFQSVIKDPESTSKTYKGKELYDYVTVEESRNILDFNRFSGYTKYLSEIKSEDSLSGIRLDSGFISKDGFVALGLQKSIKLDIDEKINLDHHNISFYRDDIILTSWNDKGQYFVISLSKRNWFGDPIIYTRTVKELNEGATGEIFGASGKYLMVRNTNGKEYLYDIIEEKVIDEYSDNFVLDECDMNNEIFRLPRQISTDFNTASKFIPSISNLLIPLNKKLIKIYRKIGNWILLKRTDGIFILAGIYNVVFLSKDELDRLMILDDCNILLKTDTGYSLYTGINQVFKLSDTIQDSYIQNFTGLSKEIVKEGIEIESSKKLFETPLDRYRRGAYPIELSTMPEIIGCFCGIIFYKHNNYINYL